ncbi:MAG: ferritin-like fold-containing protein [Kofleriaceae bacterium]
MAGAALIQVLGGVSYGEWKAFELTQTKAKLAATSEQRADWTRISAEEKRHFDGFIARLRAHGGDAERAMAPFRRTLDYFHAGMPASGIEESIWMYLGEGVANDLLVWLRTVVDRETAAFIDSVLADEVGHEGRAAEQLRRMMAEHPDHRREARRAVRTMMRRMLRSGRYAPAPLLAFLRIGRAPRLVAAIAGGFAKRLHAIGMVPLVLRGSA